MLITKDSKINDDAIVIQVHIPRTGGTSLCLLFNQVFGADKCLMNYDGELREKKPTELANVRYMAGHFGYGAHESFTKTPVYITVLRNPIDRYISTYAEFITNPKSKYHTVAQRYDVNEFLQYALDSEVSGVWQQLHNLQCRLICGEADYKKAREYIDTKYFLACPFPMVNAMVGMLSTALGVNGLMLPRVHETKQSMAAYKDMLSLSDKSITLLMNSEQEDVLLYSYVQKAFSQVREIIDTKSSIKGAKVNHSPLTENIPPKELRFMGESDEGFIQAADYLAESVLQSYGLDQHPGSILDIGCGYSRLAYGLRRANFEGEYRGFDILGRHINWLNENFHTGQKDKSYQFLHANIYNQRYNPEGKPLDELNLPYPIASFDCLVSLSVFTHLYEEEVVKYIRYLKQFMKDGGLWVATFFVLPPDFSLENQPTDATYPLVKQVSENAFIHSTDEPLLVIAFAEKFLLNLFAREGLEVVDQRKGRWLTKDNSLELKDWFMLRNRARHSDIRCLIMGNAKSGTTALFYAVANAMTGAAHFFEEPLAALYKMPSNSIAKILFEAEIEDDISNCAQLFDKRIMIIRDPKDSLVSSLLYSVAADKKFVSNDPLLKEFIRLVEKKQNSPREVNFIDLIEVLSSGRDGIERFIFNLLVRFRNINAFLKKVQEDWFIVKYEDFIDCHYDDLSNYLGLPIEKEFLVPPSYSRVERTKSHGDWRNWFTDRDVEFLKPIFLRVLGSTNYTSDWQLNSIQILNPEHGSEYILKTVKERRQTFALPPFYLDGSTSKYSTKLVGFSNSALQSCVICGGLDFGPGPNGRMASTGAAPCCRNCGSLERHRILRQIFQALPFGFLDWRRGLQFSPDQGIDPRWFRSYEVSIFDGENHLDIQSLDRADNSYDFISLNHVLESVPDDIAGFDELCRVLSPSGLMQITFGSSDIREKTIELPEPTFEWKAHHLYGRDLLNRFKCSVKGLNALVVEETDPCTGVREVVHLFTKDAAVAMRIRAWLSAWSSSIQVHL